MCSTHSRWCRLDPAGSASSGRTQPIPASSVPAGPSRFPLVPATQLVPAGSGRTQPVPAGSGPRAHCAVERPKPRKQPAKNIYIYH